MKSKGCTINQGISSFKNTQVGQDYFITFSGKWLSMHTEVGCDPLTLVWLTLDLETLLLIKRLNHTNSAHYSGSKVALYMIEEECQTLRFSSSIFTWLYCYKKMAFQSGLLRWPKQLSSTQFISICKFAQLIYRCISKCYECLFQQLKWNLIRYTWYILSL